MQKPLIKKNIITAAGPQNKDVYTPFINHSITLDLSRFSVILGYPPWLNATQIAHKNLIVSRPLTRFFVEFLIVFKFLI